MQLILDLLIAFGILGLCGVTIYSAAQGGKVKDKTKQKFMWVKLGLSVIGIIVGFIVLILAFFIPIIPVFT